jgi:hypothetical protein
MRTHAAGGCRASTLEGVGCGFLGAALHPKIESNRKASRVPLPRDLLRAVRRLDEYELRRLQILVRGLLLHADGPLDESETATGQPRVSYREEHVRCGKEGCGRCPHGPYWYAYWKEDGRTRKQYVGRHLPGQPLEEVVPEQGGGAG